jgi:recombination protein RecA
MGTTIADIREKYKNAVKDKFPTLDRFKTGLLSIDYICGGGIPLGRVIEICGKESSGKTTTSLYIAKKFLEAGFQVCIIDMEKTISRESALRSGIQLDDENLIYAQPDNGDDAVSLLIDCCSSGFGLVLIDSVPSMHPKYYKDTKIEDQRKQFSPIAGLFSRNTSSIVDAASRGNTTIIFINQERSRMAGQYQVKESYGGEFFKYVPSIKIRIEKSKDVDDGSGILSNLLCKKNKTFAQGRKCEQYIKAKSGIEKVHSLLVESERINVTRRGGSHYYMMPEYKDLFANFIGNGLAEDLKFGKSKAEALEVMNTNTELYTTLYNLVLEKLVKNPELSPPDPADQSDEMEDD